MSYIPAAHHILNLSTACSLYTALLSIPLSSPYSPVPTITWRKINGNIPKKARLRKSQAVLEIPNIQLEDSGTYECKAENPRGGTAFKGHLQVYSESEHTLVLCLFSNPLLASHQTLYESSSAAVLQTRSFRPNIIVFTTFLFCSTQFPRTFRDWNFAIFIIVTFKAGASPAPCQFAEQSKDQLYIHRR